MFRWHMNVEQSRKVSHAAHESLFAMIEQLQMVNTQLYARLWKYLSIYNTLIDLCVDFVYVVSAFESLMYGGF
jgi:hypothetical protein